MLWHILKKTFSLYREENKTQLEKENDEFLQDAINHHIKGNLQIAKNIYINILKQTPNDPDALHLLGLIAHQTGEHSEAINLIERAIKIKPDASDFYQHCASAYHALSNNEQAIVYYKKAVSVKPDNADAYNNLGLVFHDINQFYEAITSYKQALEIKPDYAEAYNNLGLSLQALDKQENAIKYFKKALNITPDFAEVHNNLGVSLQKQKKQNQAIMHYERALEIKPGYAEAHNNLGLSFQDLKQNDKAISHYKKALDIKPDYAEAHNNLGLSFQDLKQNDKAISHYKKALDIKPDYAEAYNNLGNAFKDLEHEQQAIEQYEKALAINPDFAEAHYNIGNTYQESVKLDNAIHHYEKAIEVKPDYAEAHFNIGFAYLLTGHFEKGWRNYEWRYKTLKNNNNKRQFVKPQWTGEQLKNKTIFIYTEQGIGDIIQFIRYLPMVLKLVDNVIVECDFKIVHLFSYYKDIVNFIDKDQPVPDFDVYAPLLSLPSIFNTSTNTIPKQINYIHANNKLVTFWGKRIKTSKKLKVGLCWQGNQDNERDKFRSIPLKKLDIILSNSKIDFFSLQKGYGQEQIEENDYSKMIIDYSSEMDNNERFSDTLALIDNLDLIIGVDTSIIHLAGAMGKPTWVLLSHYPDWRWMLERTDSPWYPTIKLFRQEVNGNWDSVTNKINLELQQLIN